MVTSSSTDAGGPAVGGRAVFAFRGVGDADALIACDAVGQA